MSRLNLFDIRQVDLRQWQKVNRSNWDVVMSSDKVFQTQNPATENVRLGRLATVESPKHPTVGARKADTQQDEILRQTIFHTASKLSDAPSF